MHGCLFGSIGRAVERDVSENCDWIGNEARRREGKVVLLLVALPIDRRSFFLC
jgi:hypothetical protein